MNMVENMTIGQGDRDMLMTFDTETLSKFHYDDMIKNLSWFQEENRFYNWYHGLTVISLPKYVNTISQKQKNLLLAIDTFATNGSIWTANVGETITDNNAIGSVEFSAFLNLPLDPAFRYY